MSHKTPASLANHVYAHLAAREESPPKQETLTELLRTMFFASLCTEEGEYVTCRVAYVSKRTPDPNPPERVVPDRWQAVPFDNEIELTVSNLVKLSKAVDPWVSTLAVHADRSGRLSIWGAIDQSLQYSGYVFRENNIGPEMPGMFQVAIQGIGEIAVYKRFVLLGALKRETLIERQLAVFSNGPVSDFLAGASAHFRRTAGQMVLDRINETEPDWDDALQVNLVQTVCRVLIGIQKYGHGGALLITDEEPGPKELVPKYPLEYGRLSTALVRRSASEYLEYSASQELYEKYLINQSKTVPTDLYAKEKQYRNESESVESEIRGCIRFIASLSRVDGLVWLNERLCLKGFGAEIKINRDPSDVRIALNALGTKSRGVDVEHFGMRHRSMMRFCNKYPRSLGFVVSQDGDIRAIVNNAGRVFIWENIRVLGIRNTKRK